LRKGLAIQLNEHTIQLIQSVPSVKKHCTGDEFYESLLENICVVCGTDTNLTRHHVVPQEYRKHFALEYKASASHDIVLLCIQCHERYESEAFLLKTEIANTFNIPVTGIGKYRDMDIVKAKSNAKAIIKYKSTIPDEKLIDINFRLNTFINNRLHKSQNDLYADVPVHTLHDILQLEEWIEENRYMTHGEGIVKRLSLEHDPVESIDRFCCMWRIHFLKIMKPKFLNKHWSVYRSVLR
jgi:hypothetical protein